MNRLLRFLLVTALLVAAVGCAAPTRIRTEVTAFHKLSTTTTPITYSFAPFDDQRNSLEFETYAQQVRNELTAKGWQETDPPAASVLVSFQYSIDEPTQKLVSYPIWGQTGVASSRTTGTVSTYGNTGYYSSTTTHTPTYGVTGTGTASVTTYHRYLLMQIVDGPALKNGNVKPVYEAKVRSEGTSGNLSLIVPYLLRSIFLDFPGESGSTRNEELPCPNCP